MKVPVRHDKLVRAKTTGLYFPKGCTNIAFQPKNRLHKLTGLIVEDALIPAEEGVTLVISNPGMSPVQLWEELLLGEAQPIVWLIDFTEPKNTPATENKVDCDQTDEMMEHQGIMCGGVHAHMSRALKRQSCYCKGLN